MDFCTSTKRSQGAFPCWRAAQLFDLNPLRTNPSRIDMYPGAKICEQANLVSKEDEAMNFVLRVVESLALEVQPPLTTPEPESEAKHKTDPPAPHAKISMSYPKISPALSTSKHKGNIKRSFRGDTNTKARASSVPRPRAVITSPDSDDLIGNQNLLRMERESRPQSSSYKNGRPENVSSKITTKDSGFHPKVPELRAKVPFQPELISRIVVRREKSD